MLAGTALLAADVASEAWGLRPPWAALRLVTGLAFALGAGAAVRSALRPDPSRGWAGSANQ